MKPSESPVDRASQSLTHLAVPETLHTMGAAAFGDGRSAGPGRKSSSGHAAFWVMVRRVTLLAASVDAVFLAFFLVVGSPLLAWLNVVSISMYLSAYLLLLRRRNFPALALIWTEVVVHAAIGTMLVGWDSGFHYYPLMFIPAIVVSGSGRRVVLPLLFLFIAYLGLHAAALHFGAMAPISGSALLVLNLFNVSIFFCMASYTARFYYGLVRKSERKLRELATSDALTGLSNRRHLQDLAQQEISRARHAGEPVSLVLADIDDFKQINDARGHDAGDQVLIHASRWFRDLCRAHDAVARWGGEEFLFLLPATGSEAAREFAERVRQVVSGQAVDLAGESIRFTMSMGVATLADGEHLHAAVARADRALYRSKAEGRDRVSVADDPPWPAPGEVRLEEQGIPA